jgi:phosphomannomutase
MIIGKKIDLTQIMDRKNTIVLFDIDNTLSEPRQKITPEIKQALSNLRKDVKIGTVGGSDLIKAKEQMGETLLQDMDFVFAENGTIAFENGIMIEKESIVYKLGERGVQELINYALGYMSRINVPKKRGLFCEFRSGMINLAIPGRSCTTEERKEFFEFDKKHQIRKKFVQAMKRDLEHLDLEFSIGGEISIDVYPRGFSKVYCLKFLQEYKNVLFFGDNIWKDEDGNEGNDYQLAMDPRVISFKVKNPADTLAILQKMFYV